MTDQDSWVEENDSQAETGPAELPPIPDDVRRRVLKEELERLDIEEARLVEMRREKLKRLRADRVVRSALEAVDSRDPVGVNSPGASMLGLGRLSVMREFSNSYYSQLLHLVKPREEGGEGWSWEEAIKEVNYGRVAPADEEELRVYEQETVALYEKLLNRNPDELSWNSLRELYDRDPHLAEDIWQRLKLEMREEFESGHYVAKVFEHSRDCTSPGARIEFLAIYESMVEEWKPRGGVEYSMVATLALSFFMYMKWSRKAVLVTETEPRRESHDFKEWKEGRKRYWHVNREKYSRGYSNQWIAGFWDVPYQFEADAIAQAVELAGRYRRAFHASVRQLRDYRRMMPPVIIQNPEQVNIASDGGQQVNLQKKSKKRAKKAGGARGKREPKAAARPESKQLSKKPQEESIREEPTSIRSTPASSSS